MANLYIPSELDSLIKEAHEKALRNADSDEEYVAEWEALVTELMTDEAIEEIRERRGGDL